MSAPPALPHPLCRALARAFAGSVLTALLPLPGVFANPQGPTVVHGHATFHSAGSRLTVTNSAGAAIDWRSFSIGPGELTHFQQPGSSSHVLNRVTTSNPSQLFGTLSSNGRVVLVNPAGIAVGAGALVDTAGFTASTLSISNADWIAGRMRFAGDANAGAVRVDGSIRAQVGDIVLLAPQVEVGVPGLLRASDGSVVLAAGHKAEITGRGLEGIHFEVSPRGVVRNLGHLEGDAVGLFAATLTHSGRIMARTALQAGGRVTLLADEVVLAEGSSIDADGHGAGHGGRIFVWGHDSAEVHGATSARGGPLGGNGGFIETSARHLTVTRGAQVDAPRGRAGTWLLDPDDVDVDDVPNDNVEQVGNRRKPKDPGRSKISTSALVAALDAGGEVIIDTTSSGTGNSGTIHIHKPVTKTGAAESTLALEAHKDIVVDAPVKSTSGKLNLFFHPDQDPEDERFGGATYLNADLQTAGGYVKMSAGPEFHWARNTTIDLGGGAFTVPPGSTLRIAGAGGEHRFSAGTLRNFGIVLFDDGAGDLVLDHSMFRNALAGDAERAEFGLPASSFAAGSLHFTGSAIVRGTAGTFRNEGFVFKTDVPEGATTAALDGTGLDIQLPRTSLVLVEGGTLRLGRSAPYPVTYVNEGAILIDTNGTFSTAGHELRNAQDALILGTGNLVSAHLRNEGDLFPGGLGAQSLRLSGDYTQTATGRLIARVDASGSHDRLLMSGGTAILGGKVLPAAVDGSYAEGQGFDVIAGAAQASGTVESEHGDFSTVTTAGGLRLVVGAATPPAPPPPPPPPAPAPTAAPTPAPSPAASSTADRMVAALGGEAAPSEVQKSVTELEAAVATPASAEPEKRKIDRSDPGDNGKQCR